MASMALSERLADWYWFCLIKTLNGVAWVFLLAAPAVFGWGCFVFLYQCKLWLKTGVWTHISVFEAIKDFLPNSFLIYMIMEPKDWIGVHRIVMEVLGYSAWWVLICLSALLLGPLVAIGLGIYGSSLELAKLQDQGTIRTS